MEGIAYYKCLLIEIIKTRVLITIVNNGSVFTIVIGLMCVFFCKQTWVEYLNMKYKISSIK